MKTWAILLFIACLLNACGGGGGSTPPPPPPTIPPPPANVSATAGNGQVSLTWTASTGATAYHVKRSLTSGNGYTQVGAPGAASFTDTGLTNGTPYYYVVTAVNSAGESGNSSEKSAMPTGPVTNVSVTVDVLANRHAISPYIYGTNFPNDATYISDSGTTLVRWGGNASTRYNWKNFDTNAAADWYFMNRPMGNAPLYSDSTQFVNNVKAAGGSPLMTIGMLPWVAKDSSSYSFSVATYGAQCLVNPFNSDDGNGVKPTTNCATNPTTYVTGNDVTEAHVPLLDGPPQPGDPAGSIYRSEWVTALATAFGNSPHFYNMDNEYDIWSGTHRDVHPDGTTFAELRDTFVNEARAVKGWDPQAIRFGPVSCCWYYYWNSAAGSTDKSNNANMDFFPWWLNEVYWEDQIAGARSLDIFDAHAYTEASANGLTTAQQQALAVRLPRDWWDPTYTSEAWFGTNSATRQQPLDSKPFRIPRLRALLNMIYPGTPLGFTEWSFATAGEPDFSTALADADAWGVLGRERVDYSSRWTAADLANPAYNSLKLYRNYDGAHHGFGAISVSDTNNANASLFSSYAAVNAGGTTLTVMVVNKDPQNAAQTQFTLNGFTASQVTTYTLSQAHPNSIVASSSQAWSSTMTFQPYTATLLVITGTTATPPAAEWDLNPDTTMVPASGTVALSPKFVSGSGTVTLGTPQFDTGITVAVTQGTVSSGQKGAITVTAGNTPGFYHYSVPGTDSSATTHQGGWIVVGNPAATITKTGDNQTGASLTLIATLVPGASGGTATGASIFFTTDKGTLSQRIVTTDSSGKATVVLTLPSGTGVAHVTAEGPFGLGHPTTSFTETSN